MKKLWVVDATVAVAGGEVNAFVEEDEAGPEEVKGKQFKRAEHC
jgi:hypothetical protein